MFRNILNYIPDNGQSNEMPSMTVPDETMSIRDLVSRHARGLPIKGIDKEAIFQPDIDGIPFETLDISERHELMEQTTQKIDEFKNKQEQIEVLRRKKQQDEKINEEVERRLKLKTEEENKPE